MTYRLAMMELTKELCQLVLWIVLINQLGGDHSLMSERNHKFVKFVSKMHFHNSVVSNTM